MNLITVLEILAALSGLMLAVVLTIFPRFGSAAWALVLCLVSASIGVGALAGTEIMGWPAADTARVAFAFLLLCGAGGCLASYTVGREDYAEQLRKHRWFFGVITLTAPILAAGFYASNQPPSIGSESFQIVHVGPVGYAAAVYLLVASVIGLANLEQTLRGAEEHVRWEMKFLLLGIASIFGALVYIASRILLYSPESSFLSDQDIHVFPAIFLCACVLIFKAWSRSTGRGHVVVSQGVVYSTITLFSVGLYLIVSGLLARWAGRVVQPGIPLEPIVFLLSATVLLTILLGTTFRHRTRRWIRRNIFAGRYDYRQYWMGATETVRATDSPAVAAAALAELVEHALGSLDISVWLRTDDSDSLFLTAARGSIAGSLDNEAPGLLNGLREIHEPIPVSELNARATQALPGDFIERTKASLLAPLNSSGRVVGLLTIGPDRSGRPFDRETREFVRVLALHSASEFHKSELLSTLVAAREAQAFQTFSTFLLHDLKNFASTLSLVARNAARHHANPDFQRDAFQSVLDTSEKMKKLCNSLRSFSTALATNKRVHDLNTVTRALTATFDTSIAQQLELDLNEVPAVLIDAEEMGRVLQNLILNAYEASAGKTVRCTTKLDDGSVVIEVRDQGKGIPKEFMERELFQPFRTTKRDGLGIGLFQSKKIVEAHNGKIEIHSMEGQGTVVRVLLPILQDTRLRAASTEATDEIQVLARPQTAE